MKYDYDIFISFAQSGNSGIDIEWSMKFCNLLDNLLNKITNEKPVFLTSSDVDTRVNMFKVTKDQILSSSAVFVVILSDDSLADNIFLEELNKIESLLSFSQQGPIKKSYRVFKILSSPVDFSKLPEFLRCESTYNFYETNLLNGRTQIFDLSFNSKKDNVFWSRFVDLAYDISDGLKNFKNNEKPLFYKEQSVFLASTTPDQEVYRDTLKRELKQSGINVLPDFDLPNDPEFLKEILYEILSGSRYSVHILGGYYGNYLNEIPYSAIEYQNRIVAEYLSKLPDEEEFDRIIWIPSDLKIIDQKQRLYIGRIKRDETIKSAEIIESPLEDLKSIIYNKFEHDKKVKSTKRNNALFFQYPDSDNPDVTGIINTLEQESIDIITSEMLEQENIMQKYWDLLLASERLLFYYDGNDIWFQFKVKDVLKVKGYRNKDKKIKIGIVTEETDVPLMNALNFEYTIIPTKELKNKIHTFVSDKS